MVIYSIEGVDGVGKSTVVENLKILLKNDRYNFVFTKQPFFNKKMLKIEEPFEKLFMFMVDHQRHTPILLNLVDRYHAVIIDRYMHSRIAYQTYDIVKKYYLDKNEVIKYIENLHKYTPKPDVVFLLTASEDHLYRRIVARNSNSKWENDGENIDLKRIKDIQDIYLDIASKDKKLFKVIHTDELNPNSVAMNIRNHILTDLW